MDVQTKSVAISPLVSVICFCKDRVDFIARSVDSVLSQSYRNLELVVQDGASTDGTLELLRAYAARDPRVKIVSERDSGPAEAYWKVLQRCTGDYIATCLSDEELLPGVIQQAVGWFAAEPDVGAFTCDGYTTDAKGNITGEFKAGEFDFVDYIFGKYCPFWPGSFFRRQALLDIGLKRPGWNIDCLEFEIWCRLARDHVVRYISTPVSKYAVHPGQLSNTPKNFHEHIDNRLKLIDSMFEIDGFFGGWALREKQDKVDPHWEIRRDHWFRKIEAQVSQLSQFEFHARAHKLVEEEKGFARRIAALKETALGYRERDVAVVLHPERDPSLSRKARRRAGLDQLWRGWEATTGVPHSARPQDFKLRRKMALLHFLTERIFIHLPNPLHKAVGLARILGLTEEADSQFREFADLRRLRHRAQLYDSVARIYESRGQIAEALTMWTRAEPLEDRAIDDVACQLSMKKPGATYEFLAARNQHWVDRHIRVDPTMPRAHFRPFDGVRRLRIGYHCSFMGADTIRFIMRRVFLAHDRRQFEVYGYAPEDVQDDIKSGFDVFRETAGLSDTDFTGAVRSDQIDVLVELSGLSIGHRFGAMANRCAPVQISYLNHFATSRVPNVDYILSDDICTPQDSNAYGTFSETIYRLADCLLCYDYTDDISPAVTSLPADKVGHITFACLGGAGKLNTQLIGLWAEIMRRVPNSKILIQNSQTASLPDNKRFMEDRFRRFGIGPERLELRAGTDRPGVMKAYGEVDISLDTWPYCGGNTVAESLWQGVPVVTLKGDILVSRYGSSLLSKAGCPELIADTAEDYMSIAVALASDRQRLAALRADLRRRYVEGGLNDSARFARSLEAAYVKMIEKAQAGANAGASLQQP